VKRDLFEKHWKIWCSVWKVGDRERATYWFALRDMTDEAFKKRSRFALQNFRFFPTPAEVLEIAVRQPYHAKFTPPPELTAEERERSIEACKRVSAMVKGMCSRSDSVPLAGSHGPVGRAT